MHQDPVPSRIRTITSRKHRDRLGPVGTITVVALLTLMGLAAMGGPGGIRPREAVAHAAGGEITLAHYGAASVDGIFEDGEYGDGCRVAPSQSVGGTTYHLTVCATNDDVNTYVALLIDDLTPATAGDPAGLDGITLLFDDAHDGSLVCPHAEDAIGAVSHAANGLIDLAYCGAFDTFSGDPLTNGSAAMTFSPDVGYVYELMHPLNSGDPADYALALHDTVGFCAVYLDSANAAGEVQFPMNCFGDGEKYGDLTMKGKFDAILTQLRALADSCEPCPPSVRRPLEEDIDLAIRQYIRNDEAATAQTLDALLATVKGSMQSGTLPETVGRQLIAVATSLLAELSGTEARTTAEAPAKQPHDSSARGKEKREKKEKSGKKGKGGKRAHAHRQRRDR